MNMYVFWDVGRLMERLVGSVALVVIFLLSGVAGGLASAASHPDIASIGASGAVFGVIGALFGLLLHDRQSVPPARLRELRTAILIFVVLNIFFGMSVPGIDMAAHIGGAVAGLVAGLVLVSAQAPRHWLRTALLAAGGFAAIAAACHFLPAPLDFHRFLQRQDQIIERDEELRQQRNRGDLSDTLFADKLENEVLVPWREMTQTMANSKSGPFTARQRAQFLRYLQLRQESFEDLIAAIRTDSEELEQRSEAKGNEASKIARELNAEHKGDR